MHVCMMTNRSNNHGVDRCPDNNTTCPSPWQVYNPGSYQDAQLCCRCSDTLDGCSEAACLQTEMSSMQLFTIATVMLFNASSCYAQGNEIKTSPQHGLPMLIDRNACVFHIAEHAVML